MSLSTIAKLMKQAPGKDAVQKVAAHAFIVRDDGKFLITHRVSTDDHSPDVYDLPGGTIEIAEEIESALEREVQEETGLEIAIGKVLYVFSFMSNPQRHQFQIIYEAKYKGGDIKLNESEHDSFLWTDFKQLKSLPKIKFLSAFAEYSKNIK